MENDENLSYETTSWVVGSTSFRFKDLNFNIEKQLRMLDDLQKEHPGEHWKENEPYQVLYYQKMAEEGFTKPSANRPAKDARQKTVGLVHMGLIDNDRRITSVGRMILNISSFKSDNYLGIAKDELIYLTQLLKLEYTQGDFKVRPFVSFLYCLERFGKLTDDQMAYLLPTCKNQQEVVSLCDEIEQKGSAFDVDGFITNKIFSSATYTKALDRFVNAPVINLDVIADVVMNRKSAKYSADYLPLWTSVRDIALLGYTKQRGDALKSAISGLARPGSYWAKDILKKNMAANIDGPELMARTPFNIEDEKELRRWFYVELQLNKTKANLSEYMDMNSRYFMMTGIISHQGNDFALDGVSALVFKDRLSGLLNAPYHTGADYEDFFEKYLPLEAMPGFESLSSKDVAGLVSEKYGDSVAPENLNEYLSDKKNDEYIEIIKKRYPMAKIADLIVLFKQRNDEALQAYISKDASVPTLYEFVIGIAWYQLSGMKGHIADFMNLSLGADFKPVCHASGLQSDLDFAYEKSEDFPKHDCLVEVSLSDPEAQRRMELDPVQRHLMQHIDNGGTPDDYAVFITSQLDPNIVLSFRGMKGTYWKKKDGSFIKGSKVIPLDADDMLAIIRDGITYSHLYKIFDSAFNSGLPDPVWHETCIDTPLNKSAI
jgi:hypothetical protein